MPFWVGCRDRQVKKEQKKEEAGRLRRETKIGERRYHRRAA